MEVCTPTHTAEVIGNLFYVILLVVCDGEGFRKAQSQNVSLKSKAMDTK
jgi:hypothetical protein